MFKIDDGSVLQHPGVCHVCGSQPTEGEYAIDTEVPLVDPRAPHLRGHKYVCQRCAEELVALVPDKQKDRLSVEVKKWKSKYGELVAALDTLSKTMLRVSD